MFVKKKKKTTTLIFVKTKENSLFKLIAKTLFDVDIIFKCIMATWMDGFHSFGGRVCCNILVAKECKSTNNTNTNPNHKKCITLKKNQEHHP